MNLRNLSAIADTCGRGEVAVTWSSIIFWNWGFDRFIILHVSGVGFWFTDIGIFHVHCVEVQLWSLPWDDVSHHCILQKIKNKNNPPFWLHAWDNLQLYDRKFSFFFQNVYQFHDLNCNMTWGQKIDVRNKKNWCCTYFTWDFFY